MRWLKHPSNFSRSAAMSEVRERFGAAGYGAFWIIFERIAENYKANSQKSEPELQLSEKEWRNFCGLSAKNCMTCSKFCKIMKSFFQNQPIRIFLWKRRYSCIYKTKAQGKPVKMPDRLRNDFSLQQTTEQKRSDKKKDNRTGENTVIRNALPLSLSVTACCPSRRWQNASCATSNARIRAIQGAIWKASSRKSLISIRGKKNPQNRQTAQTDNKGR